jgi:hypothetical protein
MPLPLLGSVAAGHRTIWFLFFLFLPFTFCKAVCRRLGKHFLTPPPLPLPTSLKVSCRKSPGRQYAHPDHRGVINKIQNNHIQFHNIFQHNKIRIPTNSSSYRWHLHACAQVPDKRSTRPAWAPASDSPT